MLYSKHIEINQEAIAQLSPEKKVEYFITQNDYVSTYKVLKELKSDPKNAIKYFDKIKKVLNFKNIKNTDDAIKSVLEQIKIQIPVISNEIYLSAYETFNDYQLKTEETTAKLNESVLDNYHLFKELGSTIYKAFLPTTRSLANTNSSVANKIHYLDSAYLTLEEEKVTIEPINIAINQEWKKRIHLGSSFLVIHFQDGNTHECFKELFSKSAGYLLHKMKETGLGLLKSKELAKPQKINLKHYLGTTLDPENISQYYSNTANTDNESINKSKISLLPSISVLSSLKDLAKSTTIKKTRTAGTETKEKSDDDTWGVRARLTSKKVAKKEYHNVTELTANEIKDKTRVLAAISIGTATIIIIAFVLYLSLMKPGKKAKDDDNKMETTTKYTEDVSSDPAKAQNIETKPAKQETKKETKGIIAEKAKKTPKKYKFVTETVMKKVEYTEIEKRPKYKKVLVGRSEVDGQKIYEEVADGYIEVKVKKTKVIPVEVKKEVEDK